jgi:hypothetical protein
MLRRVTLILFWPLLIVWSAWLLHATGAWAQPLGVRAYTTDAGSSDHLGLALPNGRYTIELGAGCDGMTPGVNVEYIAGSGGVGAIQLLDIEQLCNVYIDGTLSAELCFTNDEGDCDVTLEQQED